MEILLLLLPLLSSINYACFYNKYTHILSIILLSIASIIARILVTQNSDFNTYSITLYNFITINNIIFNIEIYIDKLSKIMSFLITIISTIIHVYSIGYIGNKIKNKRFFVYMSFFTFAMLFLVLSGNIVQLFIGWELVGLLSYLLIGYNYTDSKSYQAGFKAFITNRIGDLFLFIAIIIIICTKNVDFNNIHNSISILQNIYINKYNLLDITALLILLGCMTKSVQIGLHIWLPDAMKGPTPVSALIHSATMVTAGVFLLTRLYDIFEATTIVRNIIVVIGCITTITMSAIAITQNNIKKILAYSTSSQIGIMFIMCGLSSYHIAIFHLITHAFFKALLFLCAGNIIYLTKSEDLDIISHIKKNTKTTIICFLISLLALNGIYPFSGYYSKKMILENILLEPSTIKSSFAYYSILLSLVLTAIYSSKLFIKTFLLEIKSTNERSIPSTLNYTIIILGILTTMIGGGIYHTININENLLYMERLTSSNHNLKLLSITNSFTPTILTLLGLIIGTRIYYVKCYRLVSKKIYIHFKNKLYFDELYYYILQLPYKILSDKLRKIDNNIIDHYGPKKITNMIFSISFLNSKMENSYIYFYLLIGGITMIIALLNLIIIFY